MTTSPSGDESPRESVDAPSSDNSPGEGETPLDREAVVEEYQGRYPVLINVLTDYFVTSDKSLLFLERYQKQGENRAEFEGLADEIRDAIRSPKDSTPLVNAVLGSALTRQESRSMLSELLDQMLEQGDFDPQAIEDAEEDGKRESLQAEDLVAHYAKRKFAIPIKSLKQYALPMWVWLSGSAGVLLFGVLLGYLPWPDFLRWFPITFVALGIVGVAFCLVAMLGLRDEVLHPDKEERREKEKEKYLQKRDEDKEAKGGLTDRIRRTLS